MAIKPDRFSLLAGWRYGRAEFQRRELGRRGHFSWPKLGKKFPSVIVSAIKVLYSNSSSAVMVDGSISEPFDVTTGVLQGDVLAPFLFIIFVDYLLGKASGPDSGVVTCPSRLGRYPAKMLNDLDFAEDIARLESSVPRARFQLTRTADATAELGLVISTSKTEFMTIHCHPHPPMKVYETPINHVTDYKYLGSMMASSASDLKRRKALAWTAVWKLERLRKSPSIPISTKVKLFNTTCITVLLYGCESWVISKDMENKINSFGTSCYRIMLNIRRIDRVPNATIYSLTESAPLIERVRRWQLRFLGHVLRFPENEHVRDFVMYVPTHRRKKPGRQRTLFTNYIHCLLGNLDNLLNDNQLLEIAEDRHQWRKLVVDCYSTEGWWWEHHFQLQKRYLFASFMGSLETVKKVPLSHFKTSFGKVRNGRRADNIDVRISFTRKLKIPDFFFKTRYLFVTFNLNDKCRQKR